ncbi:MAG TPA: ATP-binding protein, partial [Roseiflexaceae bacterium]|nr:ATP-binding protein [Roseiflexaceae bacterium]
SELQGWISEEHMYVHVEVAGDPPLLNVDLQLLRRVALNLISNAIKHTPSGTTIVLRAYAAPENGRSPDPRVVLEIADNGPGIPPEYLETIFEKFVHMNGSKRGRYSNTGLGLTFCRLVVEAHDGSIDVTSKPGCGTTFRLELPAR